MCTISNLADAGRNITIGRVDDHILNRVRNFTILKIGHDIIWQFLYTKMTWKRIGGYHRSLLISWWAREVLTPGWIAATWFTLTAQVVRHRDFFLLLFTVQELLKDERNRFSLGGSADLAALAATDRFTASLDDGGVRQVNGTRIVIVVFVL